MPLPLPNTPWPPTRYRPVVDLAAICSIWWEGDSDRLTDRYGIGSAGFDSHKSNGVVATIAEKIRDMFWSRSRTEKNVGRRIHLPIAAGIVGAGAVMLLSDPVAFSPADDDESANNEARDRIDLILNSADMHSRMLEAAESCAALGGVFAKVVWDVDVAKHAWVEFVDCDQAIPEFVYGRLSAVTFWKVLDNDNPKQVVRHLERHERGKITHALYKGDHGNLGVLHPLTDHADTASIPVDMNSEVPTGVAGLAATYIPNRRPNPQWRHDPQLRHLGRSDISDPAVIRLFDQIDETASSLARDVRLGKSRIFIPEDMLDTVGPGKGATFDGEQEGFVKTASSGNDDTNSIEHFQAEIRVSEHLEVIDGYFREILRRIGYSPSTLGLKDDGAAMTATEVDAKRDASTSTHKAKAGLWKGALAEFGRTVIEIDALVHNTGAILTDNLDIDWPPAAVESMKVRAEAAEIMSRSLSSSVITRVKHLHPDWDIADIKAEVALVFKENSLADPLAIGSDAQFSTEPVDPDGASEPVFGSTPADETDPEEGEDE